MNQFSFVLEKHECWSLSLKDHLFFVNKWTRVIFNYFWITRKDLNACYVKYLISKKKNPQYHLQIIIFYLSYIPKLFIFLWCCFMTADQFSLKWLFLRTGVLHSYRKNEFIIFLETKSELPTNAPKTNDWTQLPQPQVNTITYWCKSHPSLLRTSGSNVRHRSQILCHLIHHDECFDLM